MKKSRLGISVGLLGAILCFSGIFWNYTVMILIAGYILIVEDNAWLKRTAVKVMVLMTFFSILYIGIGLLPDTIELIGRFVGLFGGTFTLAFLSNLVYFIQAVLSFIKVIVFMIFGWKALNQGTVVVPIVEKFISEHMD